MSRNPPSTESDLAAGSDGLERFGPTPAGEMVTLHAGTDLTNGRYDFMVTTVEPGPPVVPLHIHHEHDEAIYVLDGRIRARVGDERSTLEPGSFRVMPSGVPHTWWNAADGPSRFVCLFSPGGHVGVLEDLAELAAVEDDPGPAEFAPILERYDIEIVGPPPDAD